VGFVRLLLSDVCPADDRRAPAEISMQPPWRECQAVAYLRLQPAFFTHATRVKRVVSTEARGLVNHSVHSTKGFLFLDAWLQQGLSTVNNCVVAVHCHRHNKHTTDGRWGFHILIGSAATLEEELEVLKENKVPAKGSYSIVFSTNTEVVWIPMITC